jgi:hypothetical protein
VILFPSICEFYHLQVTNPLKICPKEINTIAGYNSGYEFNTGWQLFHARYTAWFVEVVFSWLTTWRRSFDVTLTTRVSGLCGCVFVYWYIWIGPVPKAFVYWYGWDWTVQLLVWVVIVYSWPDCFKSGLLWNYPTVGPQSGTGMTQTGSLSCTQRIRVPTYYEFNAFSSTNSEYILWYGVYITRKQYDSTRFNN